MNHQNSSILFLCELYLWSLSFGLPLYSLIVPFKETGAGFWRLIEWISFIAGLLVGFLYSYQKGYLWTLLISVLVFHLCMSLLSLVIGEWLTERPSKIFEMSFKWLRFLGCSVSLIYWSSMASSYIPISTPHSFMPIIFLLTSALLSSSVMFAMIFGHWYLVVPKLSEKRLYHVVNLLWPVLVLKMVLGIFMMILYANEQVEKLKLDSLFYLFDSFHWILLMMRMLWGYLILSVLTIVAMKLIRLRSIQSATGVLYVMVFFSIVGELMALYLAYSKGLLF